MHKLMVEGHTRQLPEGSTRLHSQWPKSHLCEGPNTRTLRLLWAHSTANQPLLLTSCHGSV